MTYPITTYDTARQSFGEAVARARTAGSAVPVSWSVPVAAADLPGAWSAARQLTDDAFLWLSAWGGPRIVTAGRAARLDGSGATRFSEVRQAWTELAGSAETGGGQGPILVGGFAFGSEAPRRPSPLPEGRMIVPAVQIIELPGVGTTLTVNAVVDADTDVEQLVEQRFDLADMLLASTALPAAGPGPEVTGRFEEPSPDGFMDLVARALEAIRAGSFDKVVVARELQLYAAAEFSVPDAVRRMLDSYPDSTLFAVHSRDESGERCFLGATPEYLVRVEDGDAHVLGLAGSAPRGATRDEDEVLAGSLLSGDKLRREHDLVCRMLEKSLSAVCVDVEAGRQPEVLALANIQHLVTRVRGRLVDPAKSDVLDLVGRLHPTPALGGHPSEPALTWLRANEPFDRGWYAAPVGWAGADGAGEFAVAIRSALISGRRASLYAGCGIVEGSEPEAEFQETCVKLLPMSEALGQAGSVRPLAVAEVVR